MSTHETLPAPSLPAASPRPRPVPSDGSDAVTLAATDATAATLAADSGGSLARNPPLDVDPEAFQLVARTTTVLPRATAGGLPAAPIEHPRYVATKVLGVGGMGEVALARDNDIDRSVAIKRLRSDIAGPEAVLRFAEEVRAVGTLEHPGIVPVYDVGVDAQGRHFFVMKYIQGETLEVIIERLAAGDPATLKRYTYEHRAQIFLQILNAVAYAHERGIVHRDIKPANILVGPHGEVVVTDWGIAKRIRPEGTPRPPREKPPTPEGHPHRPAMPVGAPAAIRCLLAGPTPRPELPRSKQAISPAAPASGAPRGLTREGALLGTPIYMSPEQARGENATLDERTDIYSLSVLFAELLSTKHYLADLQTIPEILGALRGDDFTWAYERVLTDSALTGAPHELVHVALLGMLREPELRWERAEDMIDAIERALAGDIFVCCPFTLAKRTSNRFTDWVEGHPMAVTLIVISIPVLLLATIAVLAVRLTAT